MAEPQLVHEGNLRLVGRPLRGWPEDPWAVVRQVRDLMDAQDIDTHGPPTLWFASSPLDDAPSEWDVVAGCACTGLPRPVDGLLVEDYRRLDAVTLDHKGAIRELPATWRRLREHGQAMGHRLRPYWRVRLRDRRLADGNLLPLAEVAVFLER